MPIPHPRRVGLGRGTVTEQMTGDVRDWAPPGWHWGVLPSGVRNLVRNPGPVVDPDLLWWQSRGPRSVRREPAPEEVVQQHIREEDEHVRRYMYVLDTMYRGGWAVMQGSHISYDPVAVPYLWMTTRRGSAPGRRWEEYSCCSDVLGLNKKWTRAICVTPIFDHVLSIILN